MAISDYDTTPANNTTLGGETVSNATLPNKLDDMVRQLMADIKTFYDSMPTDVPITSTAAELNLLDGLTSLNPAASGTAVTASGTEEDFTIPAWATKIDVTWLGVSHGGADQALTIQLGDAGGIEATGYDGFMTDSVAGTSTPTTYFQATSPVFRSGDSTSGGITLTNHDGNVWVASGAAYRINGAMVTVIMGGSKTLSAALTTVRLNWSAGASFDAGTINVRYS